MVTSPCEKCGEILRHSDDDVPPSGMVVKCPKCQHSVTVMPAGAAAMGMLAGGDDILSLGDDDLVEVSCSARSDDALMIRPEPRVGRLEP